MGSRPFDFEKMDARAKAEAQASTPEKNRTFIEKWRAKVARVDPAQLESIGVSLVGFTTTK